MALGCLYAHYSTGEAVETVFAGQAARMTCDADTEGYARRLFLSAVEHGEEVDRLIRDQAVNWDFARIGYMEKNILRLAISELKYFIETPAKVVMNEAIELARDYVDEASRSFINGVLDRVYKLENEQTESTEGDGDN